MLGQDWQDRGGDSWGRKSKGERTADKSQGPETVRSLGVEVDRMARFGGLEVEESEGGWRAAWDRFGMVLEEEYR